MPAPSAAPTSAPLAGATGAIDPRFSVYLDLARFLAALLVFVGHASALHPARFDLLPAWIPFATLQREAVAIFFVLSGFVIASTAARPGETARGYAIARASRILSVAAPALLLGVGLKLALVGALTPPDIAGLVASLTMLGEGWASGLLLFAPWNPPFWSIQCEVWYYAVFGLWFFGHRRAALIAAIVAGPMVALLMPVWLVGVWLARQPIRPAATAWPGIALMAGSAAAILGMDALHLDTRVTGMLDALLPGLPATLGMAARFPTDYLVALLVAAHFIGFRLLPTEGVFARWPMGLARAIRYAAGFTFSLYLYHWPLLEAARFLPQIPGPVRALLILAVIWALAQATEHRHHALRRFLARRATARPATAVLADSGRARGY